MFISWLDKVESRAIEVARANCYNLSVVKKLLLEEI